MDLSQLVPFAIFGAFTLAAWTLLNHFASKNTRASVRLDELRDPLLRGKNRGGDKGKQSTVLEKAAPTLSKALQPKTELQRNELKVRLANAGFNSPNAPTLYLALKFMSMMIGFALGVSLGFLKWGLTQKGICAMVGGAGCGMYVPELIMAFLRSARKERIFLSLPDALDLLVVCVESGLGLDAGMRRVAEELEDTAPDLCSEFNLCNFQLQMGRPRREMLHDLGIRSGVDDLRALSAILIQADRFGASIAQALRVQSDSMRVKRSQLAEERAAKTAVKMIFPLVLFIFPGIFVVLVGPAAISMINGLLTK